MLLFVIRMLYYIFLFQFTFSQKITQLCLVVRQLNFFEIFLISRDDSIYLFMALLESG